MADEEYVASVAPETQYNGATSSHFLVVGTATKTVDLTVQEPVAPPAGTEIPGSQTTALANGVQVPLFFWNEEVTLKTTGCVDGHVSATVTGTNTQTFEVQTIGPVTLGETPGHPVSSPGNCRSCSRFMARSRSPSRSKDAHIRPKKRPKNSTPTSTPAAWSSTATTPTRRSRGRR